MHIRQQIREAVVAVLLAVPALSGGVHVSRAARLVPGAAPAAVVAVPAETIERGGMLAIHRQARSITVVVHLLAAGSAVDDALDATAEAVEAALATAGTLGGLLDVELQLDEVRIDIEDTTATPAGELRMAYTARTATLAAAPGQRA